MQPAPTNDVLECGDKPEIPEGFTLESRKRYRCKVCDVFCSSLANTTSHARGVKHLKAVLGRQGLAVPNGITRDKPVLPDGCVQKPDGHFQCQICNIMCSCQMHVIQHIFGHKHLRTLASKKGTSDMATWRNEQVSTQQEDIPTGFIRQNNSLLRCIICQTSCNSLQNASDHIKGKKHRLQCNILALKENKDMLMKLPTNIDLCYGCITDKGLLDCEVSPEKNTLLTLIVTNRTDRDVLTMHCALLKDIGAVVQQDKTVLKPGESGNVAIQVKGHHLGVNCTAIAFMFVWRSQPDQRIHVVRQLRVRCTDDIVKYLQPKTKYKRTRRSKHEPRGEIVSGFPVSKMTTTNLRCAINLKIYGVPKGLGKLHSKEMKEWDNMKADLQKQLQFVTRLLESKLSPANHQKRTSLLLHCEEIQMHIDIRNYDMQGVTMSRCSENRRLVTLQVPGLAENRPSVLKGDYLYVRPLDANGKVEGKFEFQGYVHNTRLNKVWLGFGSSFMTNFLEKRKYKVRFSVNRYPARLHHRSLELANQQMDNVLFPTIDTAATLGAMEQVNNKLTVNNAKKHFKDRRLLGNAQQVAAVCSIVRGLSRPAPYLVFGPPGTGKTVTIVEAMKQGLRVQPAAHILACAPSNSAADLLAERLMTHVPLAQMYRINAVSRSIATVPECIKPCCNIDRTTQAILYPSMEELMQYSVIITTLVTAGRLVSAKFPTGHFTHVFIDEAGHAIEAEALVAIAGIIDCNQGGQVVLAGDPQQLGPIVRSPIARRYGLEMSLIERYMKTCDVYKQCDDVFDTNLITKLVCNYRSHPAILKLPNECFYEDELRPCADTLLRESLCQWEGLQKKNFPMIFHGVVGTDMREECSPSFFNPTEVSIVMGYVNKLLATQQPKITETDIGIISPYRKQVQKLQTILKKNNHVSVKTGSVEDFQGQERRVIIISTVRSNAEFFKLDIECRLGFINNPKRFNVAITRAKALLIVVGDPFILSKDKHWNKLLQECCSQGAYIGCELVDDGTATDDVLQRFTDMHLDDTEFDVSAVTRHEDPEWRHDI